MNPHVHRALVLFDQHRLGEAESEVHRLLELNPKDSAAHAMMGLCLYLQNRQADAVSHARESLWLSPAMAGYERATRAFLNRGASGSGSGSAVPSQETMAGARDARLAGVPRAGLARLASAPVHFLAPTTEITALLERWRQLLEALVPGLSRTGRHAAWSGLSPVGDGRKTVASHPLPSRARLAEDRGAHRPTYRPPGHNPEGDGSRPRPR